MNVDGKWFDELSPEEVKCLGAAEGWFELGDFEACKKELEEIRPEMRAHPDVLKFGFQTM